MTPAILSTSSEGGCAKQLTVRYQLMTTGRFAPETDASGEAVNPTTSD
jgi:hypothetical protein